MMEVEELPPAGDTEMFPEDAGWYDDQNQTMAEDMITGDVLEVEMDAAPETIEYEMEDHDLHSYDAYTVSPAEVTSSRPLESPAAVIRTPSPPAVAPPDIKFESPSHNATTERTDASPEVQEETTQPEEKEEFSVPLPASSPHTPPLVQHPHSDQPSEADKLSASYDENDQGGAPVIPESNADTSADKPETDTEKLLDETAGHEELADGSGDLSEPAPGPVSVLILNPSSTALPSFCLFAPTSAAATESASVFLEEQVELFYEPLSRIFQALREKTEELEISEHAELSLCSEGLELTISEDNLYATEISLNDLNLLHVGCELDGPFTLRFDQIVPRFITRYRAIYAELNRVHSEDEEADKASTADAVVKAGLSPGDDAEDQEDHNDLKNGLRQPDTDLSSSSPNVLRDEEDEEALQNEPITQPQDQEADPEPTYTEENAEHSSEHENHDEDGTTELQNEHAAEELKATELQTENVDPGETQPDVEAYPSSELETSEVGILEYDAQANTEDGPESVPQDADADDDDRIDNIPPLVATDDEDEIYLEVQPPKQIAVHSILKSPPTNGRDHTTLRHVAFEVSDDEPDPDQYGIEYPGGDDTQTTRYDSQGVFSQSLVFNTQDGEDVPYHEGMYDQENDEIDAYAAQIQETDPAASYPLEYLPADQDSEALADDHEIASGEIVGEDDFYEESGAGPSYLPSHLSTTSSDEWLDEPGELLPYEEDDGQAHEGATAVDNEYEDELDGDGDLEDDAQLYLEEPLAEVEALHSFDPTNDSELATDQVARATPSPSKTASAQSSFRSASGLSVKRTHDQTDHGVEESPLDRHADQKRAKIQ